MASDGGRTQACVRCGARPAAIWRWCPDCGGALVQTIDGQAVAERAGVTAYRIEPPALSAG